MTVHLQDDRRYRVDLADYMHTCDSNYRRLLHLIPALQTLRPSRTVAGAAGTQQRPAHPFPRPGERWRFTLARAARKQAGADQTVQVDIRMVESFAYTTTLEIIVASGFPAWAPAPRMQIRLYHDADTAEPVSYQGHRRIPARSDVPNARMYHQDEKRQVNEFLAEWLELCLRSGSRAEAPDTLCTS